MGFWSIDRRDRWPELAKLIEGIGETADGKTPVTDFPKSAIGGLG
jgi:hypothetical protein